MDVHEQPRVLLRDGQASPSLVASHQGREDREDDWHFVGRRLAEGPPLLGVGQPTSLGDSVDGLDSQARLATERQGIETALERLDTEQRTLLRLALAEDITDEEMRQERQRIADDRAALTARLATLEPAATARAAR